VHPRTSSSTEAEAIAALLPEMVAMVVSRPRGRYNDLAVPVKLEYVVLGRLLSSVGCCSSPTAPSRPRSCAVPTRGLVAAMADGVHRMFEAERKQLDRWSVNVARAGRSHSWRARTDTILETLGITA
jgi:hypothetical protein